MIWLSSKAKHSADELFSVNVFLHSTSAPCFEGKKEKEKNHARVHRNWISVKNYTVYYMMFTITAV